jgi:DegV family protein with EDD domain
MHVVTDSGMDLAPEQTAGLSIHTVPLTIHLDGNSYRSGIDIQNTEFYSLLTGTDSLPTTSLPSPGEIAEMYRKLAAGPGGSTEILSVHISSGLSGTYNAACEAARLVPEAKITVLDTLTLSVAQGWQVEAAARAARAGWPASQIAALVRQIREKTETLFTLPELKWLIHGGRISHLQGLVASVLNIRPLIHVSKEDGKYYTRDKKRSFRQAMAQIVNVMLLDHAEGTPLRAQVAHANNPEGAEQLREMVEARFLCTWLPATSIAPVLGAHTGPGLVGLAYAALEGYPAAP